MVNLEADFFTELMMVDWCDLYKVLGVGCGAGCWVGRREGGTEGGWVGTGKVG